jgi:hypothetical protein
VRTINVATPVAAGGRWLVEVATRISLKRSALERCARFALHTLRTDIGDLPDGQSAHGHHAQTARRVNLPHAVALASSGKSKPCSRASRLMKRDVSRSSRTWEVGSGGRDGSQAFLTPTNEPIRLRGNCDGTGTRPVAKFSHKAFADGQAVWSWRPDAGAKFPKRATRALGVTGAKEPGPRGERGVSRQTIAQGRPGVSG